MQISSRPGSEGIKVLVAKCMQETPLRNLPHDQDGQQQHPFLAEGKEAFTEPRGMERGSLCPFCVKGQRGP